MENIWLYAKKYAIPTNRNGTLKFITVYIINYLSAGMAQ
jgi:hypothetical protein